MENLDYDTITFSEIHCIKCSLNDKGLTLHGKFEEIESLPKDDVKLSAYTLISFRKNGKEVYSKRTNRPVEYFRKKYASNA